MLTDAGKLCWVFKTIHSPAGWIKHTPQTARLSLVFEVLGVYFTASAETSHNTTSSHTNQENTVYNWALYYLSNTLVKKYTVFQASSYFIIQWMGVI